MIGYIIAAIVAFFTCGWCLYWLDKGIRIDEDWVVGLSTMGMIVSLFVMMLMICDAADAHNTPQEKVIEVKEITQIDTLKVNDEVIGYKLLIIK